MPVMAPAGPRTSDAALVAAYRAGDRHAFELIHERYSARLERFAQRILQRSAPGVAEDVVQEAMLRASRALVRDDRPMDLKPWLFRLVRNCALDELGRVRMDSVTLDDELTPVVLAAPAGSEPEHAAARRAGVRDLLDDLATLPDEQRHALVRRELDGLTHEQVAAELASRRRRRRASSSARGRTSCATARRAAPTARACARSCSRPRTSTGAPPPERCATSRSALPCRAFRHELKLSGQALAILSPGLLLVGIGGAGGALYGLAGKGAAVKAGVAATAGITAAGVVIAGTQVFGPGDPVAPGGPQPRGPARRPRRAAAAARRDLDRAPAARAARRQRAARRGALHLPGAAARRRPAPGRRDRARCAPPTRAGPSSARAARRGSCCSAPARPAATSVTVGILCRRPARGRVDPRGRPACRRPRRPIASPSARRCCACARAAPRPGSVRLDQPVRVLRRSGDVVARRHRRRPQRLGAVGGAQPLPERAP